MKPLLFPSLFFFGLLLEKTSGSGSEPFLASGVLFLQSGVSEHTGVHGETLGTTGPRGCDRTVGCTLSEYYLSLSPSLSLSLPLSLALNIRSNFK